MRVNNIGIIGFGPRGLNVLERFIELITRYGITNLIHLHIINPDKPGEGSHPSSQPEHLLVNTVSSQITMYAGDSLALKQGGKSFIQWARSEGFKLENDTFTKRETGTALTDMEYMPRSLLGTYLQDNYDRLLNLLPENLKVIEHKQLAVNLIKDKQFSVILQNGDILECDFVFLTTGHGFRKPTENDTRLTRFRDAYCGSNPLLGYYSTPYPITQLDAISAQSHVLIQGFGLTAHDVISALTIGRGGHYRKAGNRLEYVASGTEPKIYLSSRQCLPFAGRGINQKGLIGRHIAQFLTPAAVEVIRQQNISELQTQQIDFESQILPLLIKEMAYAWRCAEAQKYLDPNTFVPEKEEIEKIERVLWPLRGQFFDDYQSYHNFFIELISSDLKQALLGNMNSPLKASTDVLRDVREALRRAIEFGGLTAKSHRYFIEEFNPIINRVSFGPPLRRNQELLALLDAGIVELGGGPGAQIICDESKFRYVLSCEFDQQHYEKQVDVIIAARLDSYSPLTDASELTQNLVKNGLIIPFMNGNYHPGGIAIDKSLHPINVSGQTEEKLWAIGFLVEGAHYYTHALPRSHINSRQFEDAEICVRDCIDHIISQNEFVVNKIEELI
ncbi:FAD/NAD(P)-binding protein [Xenorhabdus bovienii]|uniref:FAD-dependent urate hydroxylase HpyO/Asp monooxygenase CreE-like FAD/NAD(P)-binding domain-containing protein n=1 Tax=Xenorhabdus bovienii str. kraussei Becker Underwood TaxID=1398204 RepID=A0A077PSP3_XENBV|nr:FAD/NAD(P)-binding protein [Xenorhabdus bovienii]CDH23587.1 conserved hypothetical protein [Xenorhabdus bovienii str. kraussei Becker Underwood]